MREYRCGACGAKLKRRDLESRRVIFSTHSGNRYCPADQTDACSRRRRRKAVPA